MRLWPPSTRCRRITRFLRGRGQSPAAFSQPVGATDVPDDKELREAGALAIAFARFEGVITTEFKNLSHDVKGITATLAAHAEMFMPRKEAEREHEKIGKRLSDHSERLDEVEAEQSAARERQNKVMFWAVSGSTLLGGFLSFLGRKFGWTS